MKKIILRLIVLLCFQSKSLGMTPSSSDFLDPIRKYEETLNKVTQELFSTPKNDKIHPIQALILQYSYIYIYVKNMITQSVDYNVLTFYEATPNIRIINLKDFFAHKLCIEKQFFKLIYHDRSQKKEFETNPLMLVSDKISMDQILRIVPKSPPKPILYQSCPACLNIITYFGKEKMLVNRFQHFPQCHKAHLVSSFFRKKPYA